MISASPRGSRFPGISAFRALVVMHWFAREGSNLQEPPTKKQDGGNADRHHHAEHEDLFLAVINDEKAVEHQTDHY